MKHNEKLQLKGLYFVLPTVIIYALFLFYPMISAFQYSFYKWNLVSDKQFVGLSKGWHDEQKFNFIFIVGQRTSVH